MTVVVEVLFIGAIFQVFTSGILLPKSLVEGIREEHTADAYFEQNEK